MQLHLIFRMGRRVEWDSKKNPDNSLIKRLNQKQFDKDTAKMSIQAFTHESQRSVLTSTLVSLLLSWCCEFLKLFKKALNRSMIRMTLNYNRTRESCLLPQIPRPCLKQIRQSLQEKRNLKKKKKKACFHGLHTQTTSSVTEP